MFAPRPLPISEILLTSVKVANVYRDAVLIVATVPAIGMAILASLPFQGTGVVGLALVPLKAVFWSLLALGCLRVTLLGPKSMDLSYLPSWGNLEWQFYLRVLLVAVGAAVLFGLPALLPVDSLSPWLEVVLAGAVLGRVVLVFPALVVGGRSDWMTAWTLSSSSAWRLTVIPVLLVLTLDTVPMWAAAHLPPYLVVAVVLLSTLIAMLAMIALGIAYRILSHQSRSPAVP